jgi:hypothetical protein
VKEAWEDCDVMTQARIIAFHQVREHDEAEETANLLGGGGKKGAKR